MTSYQPSPSTAPLAGDSAARTNSAWSHQVELRLDRSGAGVRLRRIEAWCADWQIGVRVMSTLDPCAVRVCFEEPKFARAFVNHFGGVIVDAAEVERSMSEDAAAEDMFDRLAREYDEDD